jgi:hypothetical protein
VNLPMICAMGVAAIVMHLRHLYEGSSTPSDARREACTTDAMGLTMTGAHASIDIAMLLAEDC